jgi:TolB-like protein/DNA-binding winged helix-turn-helix (wHTH) protein
MVKGTSMSLRSGFTLGDWTIYPLEGRLVRDDNDRRIPPKSMDVLLCLAEAEGGVVERETLLFTVWNDRAQTDEPLTRCIGELRKALGDTRSEPRYIVTIPKRGYRLLKPAISLDESSNTERSGDEPPLTQSQKFRQFATFKKLLAGLGVLLVAAIIQVIVERTVEDVTGGDPSAPSGRGGLSAKSVVVLGFSDLSQNGDQVWFAEGLTEEVRNALTHTPDILVSSRTSANAYDSADKDAASFARGLGVAHALQGSVRRDGDQIRVTARLIRAADEFHVWSQNYDRDASGLFEIQEDIALQIATALETTMDPEALANMASVGTRSVEAYQSYIRGVAESVQVLSDLGNKRVLNANAYFERARQIDPGFSAAHRQAANFWVYQLTPADTRRGLSELPVPQMQDEFLSRIDMAIETAASDVDRKVMMAQKARVQLRLQDSIQLFKEYLGERPHDLPAWQGLLSSALFASDKDTVIEVLEHYFSVGKSDVQAAIYYMSNAYQWVDPSEAADFGLKAVERWPNNRALKYQTHRTLIWAMRVEEAAILAEQFGSEDEASPMLLARQACAEGRRAEVEQMLAARRDAGQNLNVADWFMYLFLDDTEHAAEFLHQFDSEEVPFRLATWLHYHIMDPRPFPVLMKILEQENVNRRLPATIPFACPAV